MSSDNFVGQDKTLGAFLNEVHFALRADHVIMINKGKLHLQGSSQDPATHQALIELFDSRIRLEKLVSDWITLPN
jgi:iron complex transport system ATP-binding protein